MKASKRVFWMHRDVESLSECRGSARRETNNSKHNRKSGRQKKLTKQARASSVLSWSTPSKQIFMTIMKHFSNVPTCDNVLHMSTTEIKIDLMFFTFVE